MKTILKVAVAAVAAVAVLIPSLADAQAGRMHRATRRRTAVVVGSTVKAEDSAKAAQTQQQAAAAQQQAATSQQQAAASQQQAAAAQKEADAAKQEAAAAKAAAAAPPPPAVPLPVGTVVAKLPAGCVATAVSGVEYYSCGGNYYRAAFQGDALVYVTAKPK
jgi:ATPase subunit of ABC transporter with duplicated ATPase domains